MKEIWRDIPGYEDWYEVSNLGRVKSIDKRKILKTDIGKKGYERVGLTKDFKRKTFNVHKLVALAFIDNPLNKPQINHINGIKTDNRVKNLEWCTAKENVIHAVKNGLKVAKKGFECTSSKSVEQYDFKGNLIKVYGSINEAERETGVKHQSIISNLKGRYKKAGNFVWKYRESMLKEME